MTNTHTQQKAERQLNAKKTSGTVLLNLLQNGEHSCSSVKLLQHLLEILTASSVHSNLELEQLLGKGNCW